MKVRICSRADMEKLLSRGFDEEAAVISLYDPENSSRDYAPVDYSGRDIRLFQFAIRDTDLSSLKRYGMRYGDYFPESDELARFIVKAVNDNAAIYCQCDYGQSRSAGCAAAILEHFEKNGIAVFADDKYLPNQMIFNKLMYSLKKVHTEPTLGEVLNTLNEDRYYNYIERANRLCRNGKNDEALRILDMLLQILSSEMGENSMHTAYVYYYSARICRYSKRFDEAEKMYRKALYICELNKQNRAGLRFRRSLALMFSEMKLPEKVVSECKAELDKQMEYDDSVFVGHARVLYGDALFHIHRYYDAIDQWGKAGNAEPPSMLYKISKAYEAIGDTENSAEYLHKSRNADKAYIMHKERLEKLSSEIEKLRAETEEY